MHKDAQDEKVKIPFWPTRTQVLGGLGFVVGVNAGPAVVCLAFWLLEWLRPGSTDDSLLFVIFAFLASIPLGAMAGISLGLAAGDRLESRKWGKHSVVLSQDAHEDSQEDV